MSFFTWNEKYSVGIRELDSQHKQLFNILNELYDAMQQGAAASKLSKIVLELANYTKVHFATEEKYMEKFGYAGLPLQKMEHANFVRKVEEFKRDCETGKTTVSLDIANFVKDWLSGHILGSDKQYGPVLKQKGAV